MRRSAGEGLHLVLAGLPEKSWRSLASTHIEITAPSASLIGLARPLVSSFDLSRDVGEGASCQFGTSLVGLNRRRIAETVPLKICTQLTLKLGWEAQHRMVEVHQQLPVSQLVPAVNFFAAPPSGNTYGT